MKRMRITSTLARGSFPSSCRKTSPRHLPKPLELEKQRREDRAVALPDVRRRRLRFVVVDPRQLQFQARGDGRGQAGIEVVEGVAEVVRLPDRGQLLGQFARRR